MTTCTPAQTIADANTAYPMSASMLVTLAQEKVEREIELDRDRQKQTDKSNPTTSSASTLYSRCGRDADTDHGSSVFLSQQLRYCWEHHVVAFPKRRNRRRALRKQWDDKGSTNGVMSMSTHRHAPSARLCVEKERKRERKKKRRKKRGSERKETHD